MRQLVTRNGGQQRRGLSPLFGELDRWHDELDRVFENALGGWVVPRRDEATGQTGTLGITADLIETDNDYQVVAEMPGVEEKNINVTMSGNTLIIEAEKNEEKEDRERNYHRYERVFGRFHRQIMLPDDVDTEHADARFKNGVLRITLPKSPKAKEKTRKITVKS